MNLLLFSKLLLVGAVWAPFLTEAEANIEACSPSNTNIVIDAQVPGVLSTPIFPDGSTDSSCIWKIQAAGNFRLAITIEVLTLNGADDFLVIRDGASTFSPLIGKYGPCASGSLTLFSSGSSVFLQTVSAVFSENDKLRITYKPTDPDDIDCSNGENPPNLCGINTELRGQSGVITSPNFPNNYDADETCIWTINAPPGYRVQFTIRWIGIEDHQYSRPGTCGDDAISVSEYRGNNTRDVKLFCGCKTLFSFVSYMEKMWLRFDSYKKNNWPGFVATYHALTSEECPAGKTDCAQKNTGPIGFNAQGQVCTTTVKTSSEAALPQGTSSSLTSSVKSYAMEESLTRSKALQIKTTVKSKSSEDIAWHPMTSTPLLVSHKPAQRTSLKQMQTQLDISPSRISPTSSSGSVLHSSEVIMHTSVSSLKSSNLELASVLISDSITPIGQLKPSRDVLTSVELRDIKGISTSRDQTGSSYMELATVVTSSPEYPKQTLERATSSFKVSGTYFAQIEDSNSIPPIDQLKLSRDVLTSVGSLNIKGTSIFSNETGVFKASLSTASYQSKSLAPGQTEAINPIASAGSHQSETLVPEETQVKGSSMAADYKTRQSIKPSDFIGSYQNEISMPRETKMVVHATSIADVIKPSALTGSYPSETFVPETDVEQISTATEYKNEGITPSASIGSYQSVTLIAKRTTPVVPTSYLTRLDYVKSQSEHVNPTSESEHIIIPSKAREETSAAPQATLVEQTTTKHPPVTGTDSTPKGLVVKCTHYAMEITISRALRPYLDISSLHLQDPSCKASFSNDTHAFLSAPLEECGTQQMTSKDYFIYLNTMTGDEKSSTSSADITRKGRVKFEFQCSFRKLHVLSIVSYSTRRKVVRTADGDGVGNFTFEMDMFKDPKYDIVVNQYPVKVYPSQPMYLQVNVKSRDRNLLTFLEKCWVTPTPDPRDQTRHTIIEQGCSRDSTLQYLYKKSSIQKFTFQAFSFRHVMSSRLYVHCKVVTCRLSDTGSVCDRGCTEGSRHRRENKAFIMDKEVFLSLGPVNFQDQSEGHSAQSHEPVAYVTALVSVLAALALILFIAIVILILRRRKLHKNKNNTWILLATREHNVQEGHQKQQIPQAEM